MNKVNLLDLSWNNNITEAFASRRKQIGQAAGGKKIGTSVFQLLPGEKAFPFHAHLANEEAVFILSGEGQMRIGSEKINISEHDYIALPAGDAFAHQIINTSDKPLEYLCISTMIEPDVILYPDSEKVGLLSGSAPGGKKTPHSKKHFFKLNSAVSYFKDEK